MRVVNKIFYKPYWRYLITDILLLVISFFVVLTWFPLSTQIPYQKYDHFAVVFAALWIAVSYFGHRYKPVKYQKIGYSYIRLIIVALVMGGLMHFYMWGIAPDHQFSIYVHLTILGAMVICSMVYLLISHAYRYASNEEPEIERGPERGQQSVLQPPIYITDEQQKADLQTSIAEYASLDLLPYLKEKVDLYSSNTFLTYSSELFNFQKLPRYTYDTIINICPLNQIRGINKLFGVVNDHLPDNGLLVVRFTANKYIKKQFLDKYPPVLNWLLYIGYFFYKRVVPKLFMTSRLYYDITEGKNRLLSTTEVLGRLCYCGFEIVDEKVINNETYVIARRSFRPQTVQRKMYGIFVKLNRVGKNGKLIKVYKFRTMHPYSEYLQAYIHQQNGLQEGGKFAQDRRVTTLGHFMRKYWIDELPMLLNLIKGDMKVVGVRPISKHYFSLYSKELQEKRVHHKPGLLPPFYADMPKTLEEIQASEMKYLTRCEEKGTFATDFVYFWKIFYTIIFKKARSK